MIHATRLAEVISEFTQLTWDCPDSDLDRPWTWMDHREGVRFAFFRNYEDLRALAGQLHADRLRAGWPPSRAQQALAGYHAAYRDLLAVLAGVDDAEASRPPSPGEWPVSVTVKHIIGADRGFFGVIQYARERARRGASLPEKMPSEFQEALWSGDAYPHFPRETHLSTLLAYYQNLHERALGETADILDGELELPAYFWESTPMPILYRLHRFDSHLRQHTVQVEKALATLQSPPNEAKRLLRLVHSALAQVESMKLGVSDMGNAAVEALADQIQERTQQIAAILGRA